jgi:hypothetical protein
MRLLRRIAERVRIGWHWFKRAAPLHMLVVITIMSYLTSLAPTQWTVFVRIFNGYLIAGFLMFGYFRFGREARTGRKELHEHRTEVTALITKLMQENITAIWEAAARRDAEIQALAIRAAEIAETLATETKVSLETTHQKLNGLSDQVKEGTAHARSAYEVSDRALTAANSVNEKISEQNEAIMKQQEAAQHVGEQMEHLLMRFDTVGERQQEIQAAVIDAKDIIRRELLERDDHITRQQIDEIQHTAEKIEESLNLEKRNKS